MYNAIITCTNGIHSLLLGGHFQMYQYTLLNTTMPVLDILQSYWFKITEYQIEEKSDKLILSNIYSHIVTCMPKVFIVQIS